MSAEDTDRRAPTAPLVLLWIAIALAPVAGTLIVLGGGGGLLRAGGALAMLAVVLVALGSVLARAGSGGRAGSDVEAYVGDEVEALRGDVRADISRATKASHRVLGEQIAALGDTVEALRGQIEVLRSHVERNHIAAPTPAVGGHAPVTGVAGVPGGVFRHTETVQVTTRQTMIDDTGYGDRVGSVYGSAASPGAVPGQRRAEHDGYKADARGRDEYTDRDGYAGARRAHQDDEPTGGWSSAREVHVGERNSEVRIDDTAAQMRTQDRWASMVQRDAEPAAAAPARRAESSGGRRRRDDGDEDSRYWSDLRADAAQQRGTEPVWGADRGGQPAWGADRAAQPAWGTERGAGEPARAEVPRPALPAAPSGEQVPAWASGRTGRPEEPVPAAAQHRGTQYGGGMEYGRVGSHAGGGEYGRGPDGGGTQYGGAGGQGGTEYGRAGGQSGGAEYGGTGYGRPSGGGEFGAANGNASRGGAEYGGANGDARRGGTEPGRVGDTTDYTRAHAAAVRATGGPEYGGTQYGGGSPQFGGTQYGHAAGNEYERTGGGYGGTEYGGSAYETTSGQHGAGEPNRYQNNQGYQDDEPTGRRSRHGDWR
jgi:hypothetical protein